MLKKKQSIMGKLKIGKHGIAKGKFGAVKKMAKQGSHAKLTAKHRTRKRRIGYGPTVPPPPPPPNKVHEYA